MVAFKSLDGLSERKETGSEKERGGGMSTQVFLPWIIYEDRNNTPHNPSSSKYHHLTSIYNSIKTTNLFSYQSPISRALLSLQPYLDITRFFYSISIVFVFPKTWSAVFPQGCCKYVGERRDRWRGLGGWSVVKGFESGGGGGSEGLKVGGMLVVGEDAVQFRILIYSSLAIKWLRWFLDCCSRYQVVMG